jgi:hypothetical protein
MYPGKVLLKSIENIKLSAESITREALIRDIFNAKEDRLPDGSTYYHSSITVYSEELTVFLGYQNNTLMTDLTDWYDSPDEWTYRIKNGPSDIIKGLWINILGATTPSILRSALSLEAIGGGLTSRIIFVFEEQKGKDVIFPFRYAKDPIFENQLMADLHKNHALYGEFVFSKDFYDAYEYWFSNEKPKFEKRVLGTFLESYTTRRPIMHIKLSTVMNVSRSGDMLVTGDDFNRAVLILTETEKKMPFTFKGVGASPDAQVMSRMISIISYNKEILRSALFDKLKYDATFERLNDMLKAIQSTKRVSIEFTSDRNDAIIKLLNQEE